MEIPLMMIQRPNVADTSGLSASLTNISFSPTTRVRSGLFDPGSTLLWSIHTKPVNTGYSQVVGIQVRLGS